MAQRIKWWTVFGLKNARLRARRRKRGGIKRLGRKWRGCVAALTAGGYGGVKLTVGFGKKQRQWHLAKWEQVAFKTRMIKANGGYYFSFNSSRGGQWKL